jgi:hypothetical protein
MCLSDLVVVGDVADAVELQSEYNVGGPTILAHRALSLSGRADTSAHGKITAFLPRNSGESLATILAAFDAIPEAWIDDYKLEVIMRYSDTKMPDMVANSFHADHIRLIGEDICEADLTELCSTSSALSLTAPDLNSRAFYTAAESGVATVVLTDSGVPVVGQGYVGGLIADQNRPSSVYVALNHALRLGGLRFPAPDAWADLVSGLIVPPINEVVAKGNSESVSMA